MSVEVARRSFLKTGLLATIGFTLWRPGPLSLYRDQPQSIHKNGVVLALLDEHRNEFCAPGYARLHTRPEQWSSIQKPGSVEIRNTVQLNFAQAPCDWGTLVWMRVYKQGMLQYFEHPVTYSAYVSKGLIVTFDSGNISFMYIPPDLTTFSQNMAEVLSLKGVA